MGKVIKTIPFLNRFSSQSFHDFGRAFRHHEVEILSSMQNILQMESLGDHLRLVRDFEQHFAKSLRVKYATGVASGTDALYFALKAIGVGPGRNVITVANTWMTTISTVYELGASCVFIDVDYNTGLMDTKCLEDAINSDTAAIIPVHMYGSMVDMLQLTEIARKHHIPVIEDACQAVGASMAGRAAGAWGEIGCFSFHATKLVGGPGDGGMVTSNDKQRHQQVRQLALPDWNAPIDKVQARIPSRLAAIMIPFLEARMRKLGENIRCRRNQFLLYKEALSDINDLRILTPLPNVQGAYRNCILVSPLAGKMLRELHSRRFAVDVIYPHSTKRVEELNKLGWRLPITAEIAANHVALPLGEHITDQDIANVVSSIRKLKG